ncbi:hypothetical protein F2Q69_00048736 [Brassica cretica]|uniref:Uncharacterized protein n=1 Tax=Brassica cretica TaxID=69181 RepID=A0A8S9PSX7_BRACR|nr:hypothetical protein F2Q69_00048736 [Brassica cretica]
MSYRRFGRARSLRSDRTPARARSLRSDRAEWTFGRYVATELWLELGRYLECSRRCCLPPPDLDSLPFFPYSLRNQASWHTCLHQCLRHFVWPKLLLVQAQVGLLPDGPPDENACPSSVSSRPKLSLARPWVLECRVGWGRRTLVRSVWSSGRGSSRCSNRDAHGTARSV